LLDHGFAYDASVYTSIRPVNLDIQFAHAKCPFRVIRGETSLVEFPFTSLATVRIVFALSYAKLLGWGSYSTLLKVFACQTLRSCFPIHTTFIFARFQIAQSMGGKLALSRNSARAFDYFEKLIVT